jgi:uncharacterized membrane protein YhaH (DUF805 family)
MHVQARLLFISIDLILKQGGKIMNWYLAAFKKYAQFSGRSRRTEFWMFFLFNFIAAAILGVLDNLVGTNGILAGVYGLIVLIPGLALNIRRLHDLNKSGGFIFINLIPLVGSIWYLVLMCTEGTRGDNKYGPDPKAVG